MSENTINSNISIEEIIAPKLNESKYATGLSDVFDNINDNFIKLANHDFVKGENGDSVIIESVPLYENSNFTTGIGEAFKKFIEGKDGALDKDGALKTISYNGEVYDVWSTFKKSPGTLQMIYTVSTDENGKSKQDAISSLYYVFLDGRFNNNNLKNIDWNTINDIEDLSCIVVYSNGEFKSLDNAFPTVYYEKGVGLCWKINGNNTGLPVQGIQGRDGIDAKLFIVKGEDATETNTNLSMKITEIFDGKNGFVPASIDKYDFSILEIDKDYSAVILTNISDNGINNFYFGSIRLENVVNESEEKTIQLNGYVDTNYNINTLIQNETLINLFKDINFKDRTGKKLPGLFIPIETPEQADLDNNEEQAAHLIAATSITNNEGDSNLNTDMIWVPVNDINLENDTSKSVSVDKYLYIKIDKNEIERMIKESWQQGNYETNSSDDKFIDKNNLDNIIKQFNDTLTKTDYILKYKLLGTVRNGSDTVDEFLSSNKHIFDFSYNTEAETTNSTDFISENKAQCLYSYNDNKILNLKQFRSVKEDSKPTTNNPVDYISLRSLVKKLWPGYIPSRLDPNEKVTASDYYHRGQLPASEEEKEKFKTVRLDLIDDNQYIAADRDYENINLLPEYFIELITQQKPIYRWKLDFNYNEFDNNLLKQNAELDETTQTYNYNFLSPDDKKILILFNTIFTDTITPSELSQFLWFNGFTKDLRKDYTERFEGIWNDGVTEEDKKDPKPYGVITTKTYSKAINTTAGFSLTWQDEAKTPVSTILLSGWNYDNTKLFKLIQFVPIFNNDFKINDDTTLNINYNINVSGDKDAYNKKNITVNGALNSIEVNTNTLNALEIKNIYTNDDIVLGGDNSKLIIKPKNIYDENESSDTTVDTNIYTELESTNISTNNLNTNNLNTNNLNSNNILSKSLSINDVNSNKEVISTIEYNNVEYGKVIYKDLNISLQGEKAINIEFNLSPESVTDNTSSSAPNPLNISINKNDQSTNNDLVLNTNFNNIDITNNTTDFINFTDPQTSVIDYVESPNFDLAEVADILPNSVLTISKKEYQVAEGSIVSVGPDCTNPNNNTESQLKYRNYKLEGDDYLEIRSLESILSEYDIPIFTKDANSDDKYNILSGLKYDNKLEKDTNNTINLNKKFKLKINKIFTFIAGINAERDNYKWPYLDNGNVKIKLRYTLINKDNTTEPIELFDEDELITTKYFDIIGNDWIGKTVWGNDVDSRHARDRMYQFHFKIDTLTTSIYNSILDKIVKQLSNKKDSELKNYNLNVKVISSITAGWWHPGGLNIYGAFLALPIVVSKFNNGTFKFTAGNNIQFSSNFNDVVWENYTTVTADIASNGTSKPGWSSKFSTDYEYYLTPIKSNAVNFEPNLNLCSSGLYISNNYSTTPEVVGLGFDSKGSAKLIRKYVASNTNTSSSITIANLIECANTISEITSEITIEKLIACVKAYEANTEAQVGL